MTMRFVSFFAVTLLASMLVGCGSSGSSSSSPPPPPVQAATPTFSVPSGTYSSAQTVTISDATPGATIYYTTDGTTPTTSSTQYTGPITVSSTETIEAIATASGYSTSAVATAAYTITPPPVAAVIDFGTVYQTIRGFGGSDAWMPVMPSAEVNALFGTGSNQIGLSILRGRIDPSSTAPGSQWDAEVTNAQNAIAAGSGVSIIATPWTPPVAWKINVPDPNHPLWGGSLDPNHYSDYAAYLESFVTYMANGGVNLYGISMQNEPDANVQYDSCAWTPKQMDTWVANNASVLTTKLIMPESQSFNQNYSDPALSDLNAVGNIGIIAGHLYGVSPTYYANAVNAGKEVWMTEHYLNPAGAQPAIGDALQVALEIHQSMTVADYNAYVWWWVADWNPSSGTTNTGLVDTNNAPTYFGWAMAQYARFVRPGYVRVDVVYSTPSVYVSAYKGNGHFVIVAINMGTSAVSQPFEIQNQSLSSLVPYQTTGSATMAQQETVSVIDNQFTYDLPAQSITTFVE
jgi:glucuronoarabinoxylan endo-1,4-beta-xylanase